MAFEDRENLDLGSLLVGKPLVQVMDGADFTVWLEKGFSLLEGLDLL